MVLTIVTALAQARLLGSDGRGDVARFVNAGSLLVLYLGLGISSAITYFLASGVASERRLFGTLRPIFVGTVVAACLGVLVVANTPLGRLLPQSASTGLVTGALTVFFGLSQAGSWAAAIHASSGRFAPINLSALVAGALATVGTLSLLVLRPSWAGAGAIIGLIIVSEAVRVTVLVAALGPPFPRPTDVSAGLGLRAIWRYSALSYLADAVQFLTYRLDMWVVDASHGASELGKYAVAVSLAQLVWIIPSAAGRVLFPFTAMMDERPAAVLAWRAAGVTFLIAFALAAAGSVAAVLVLPTLLGHDFDQVPLLVGVLSLGVVPYSVAKILGSYLAGRNALGTNLATASLVLALTIALDVLLIPPYGALGAALASAMSYGAYTVLLVWICVRRLVTIRQTSD
jgi:O-antigen/teichoic acid export membrane protein